ncbi:MAG: GNAT family N-acetyltransferase [Fretibacterium sp.]|nr:GNAT family N-acetyltransferase [Fretibacterium sp.]
MNTELWDNLSFFLTRLRALPCCESQAFPGGFCLSTGSESASENWAFFPGLSPEAELTGAVLHFFEKRRLPFVWPAETGEASGALTDAGLRERGRLVVMDRDAACLPDGSGAVTVHPVSSREEAVGWAETSWRGFDGESPAPETFQKLAEAMSEDSPVLRLVTARFEGEDAGTFLLALSRNAAGIYYFATVPEFRRRGVASAMMAEAGRMALAAGCPRLVLQSTPTGLPFYRRAGFAPLGELALFSFSEDVF